MYRERAGSTARGLSLSIDRGVPVNDRELVVGYVDLATQPEAGATHIPWAVLGLQARVGHRQHLKKLGVGGRGQLRVVVFNVTVEGK